MILVTKPFFPNKSEYKAYIDTIWDNQWVTNNGPLLNEFEVSASNYLGVKRPLMVSNGTIALQLAIKALELTKEVITTPFSYVATSSSLVWEGCKPIFADIDCNTLNIDPVKIEEKITSNTQAILATHCFGNSCDIEAIDKIAKSNNLKVIYDAAHCFGTTYKGKSIFNFGDFSTCSLHATKLMHSVEGGLLFTKNQKISDKLNYLRNFGHHGHEEFKGLGINGKNSEFHAAMGLCVLKHQEELSLKRKEQSLYYDDLFEKFDIAHPTILADCESNRSYYPIIFENEKACLRAKNGLAELDVFARRYFFPSLNTLQYITKQETPIAEKISQCILCLPLYHDLKKSEQKMIAQILMNSLL